jgi:hypothetical protein
MEARPSAVLLAEGSFSAPAKNIGATNLAPLIKGIYRATGSTAVREPKFLGAVHLSPMCGKIHKDAYAISCTLFVQGLLRAAADARGDEPEANEPKGAVA